MWKRLFNDVLENKTPPPELGGKERWRYFLSIGCWFLLVLGVGLAGFFLGTLVDFIALNGIAPIREGGVGAIWGNSIAEANTKKLSQSGLLISMCLLVVGAFLGQLLWNVIFVKTGYLSKPTAARLYSNRAPTEKGERIRVVIGYVLYLSILFGFGIALAVFGERTPKQILAAVVLNGCGVYIAIHAYLRYRRY